MGVTRAVARMLVKPEANANIMKNIMNIYRKIQIMS